MPSAPRLYATKTAASGSLSCRNGSGPTSRSPSYSFSEPRVDVLWIVGRFYLVQLRITFAPAGQNHLARAPKYLGRLLAKPIFLGSRASREIHASRTPQSGPSTPTARSPESARAQPRARPRREPGTTPSGPLIARKRRRCELAGTPQGVHERSTKRSVSESSAVSHFHSQARASDRDRSGSG